jgi:hypothetical protein
MSKQNRRRDCAGVEHLVVASSTLAWVRPDDFSPRPATEAITSTTCRVIPGIRIHCKRRPRLGRDMKRFAHGRDPCVSAPARIRLGASLHLPKLGRGSRHRARSWRRPRRELRLADARTRQSKPTLPSMGKSGTAPVPVEKVTCPRSLRSGLSSIPSIGA